MIKFYTAEIGVDLIFTLHDLGGDECNNGEPLLDTPDVGWPKLFVEGLPASPITLDPAPGPGNYHHLILADEWPVGADEVIHYYEAYIEFKNPTKTILTDEFIISVIKAPSVSL